MHVPTGRTTEGVVWPRKDFKGNNTILCPAKERNFTPETKWPSQWMRKKRHRESIQITIRITCRFFDQTYYDLFVLQGNLLSSKKMFFSPLLRARHLPRPTIEHGKHFYDGTKSQGHYEKANLGHRVLSHLLWPQTAERHCGCGVINSLIPCWIHCTLQRGVSRPEDDVLSKSQIPFKAEVNVVTPDNSSAAWWPLTPFLQLGSTCVLRPFFTWYKWMNSWPNLASFASQLCTTISKLIYI